MILICKGQDKKKTQLDLLTMALPFWEELISPKHKPPASPGDAVVNWYSFLSHRVASTIFSLAILSVTVKH